MIKYRPDRALEVYRALQAVIGQEAQTPEGQAAIVRTFELALIEESRALIIVDLPDHMVDSVSRALEKA